MYHETEEKTEQTADHRGGLYARQSQGGKTRGDCRAREAGFIEIGAPQVKEGLWPQASEEGRHQFRWPALFFVNAFHLIDALNYVLSPFPDTVDIKDGDKFIFEKPEVRYEKEWPDVLLRDGKYSIVHHLPWPESRTITTPDTSNYDDIIMTESKIGEMACFILCKRDGKRGAVYSKGLQYSFILIVPYIYDTPEEVPVKLI